MDKLKMQGVIGIGLVNVAVIVAQSCLIYGSGFNLPVTVTAVVGSLITTAVCVYFIIHILKR